MSNHDTVAHGEADETLKHFGKMLDLHQSAETHLNDLTVSGKTTAAEVQYSWLVSYVF